MSLKESYHPEFYFREYGHSLVQALLSESVLLALARYQRLGEINEKERKDLERGMQFFSDLIEGVTAKDLPNSRAVALGKLFNEVIVIIPEPLPSEASFIDYISKLRHPTQKALAGEPLDPKEVRSVQEFLKTYGESQARRAEEFCRRIK